MKKLSTGSQHRAELSVQTRARNDISCSGGYRMSLISKNICKIQNSSTRRIVVIFVNVNLV